MLTIILLVVEQLVRSDHVHQADDTAVLVVLSSTSSSQHGDGTNSTIEASRLLQTDSRTRDLEVTIADTDFVQAFNDSVDDLVVHILAEGDTLRYS
jgi:hypothetical protein